MPKPNLEEAPPDLSFEEAKASGDFNETMVVLDGCEKGLRVWFEDLMDHPASWGAYLAEVGRTIAPELAELNDISEEEALESIVKGFNSAMSFFGRSPEH